MYREKRIVGLIPARGGSKGLPRKNIRLLGGRPLISYTIKAALDCPLIDMVVVSTEDREIKQVGLQCGAQVLDRPLELAQDDTTSASVVVHALHALADLGRSFDILVLLQPTSPLRTGTHIRESIEVFSESSAQALISVCESEHTPYKNFKLNRGYLVPLFSEEHLFMPRKALPPVFRQNGAIYIISTSEFLRTKSFYLPATVPYMMDVKDSVDIDDETDLHLAEQLLSAR